MAKSNRNGELVKYGKKIYKEPNKKETGSENLSWIWIVIIVLAIAGLLGKIM